MNVGNIQGYSLYEMSKTVRQLDERITDSEAGDTAPGEGFSDRVNISPQALWCMFCKDLGVDPSKGAIDIGDLEGAVDRDTASIQNRLASVLDALGADAKEKCTLTGNGQGGIIVKGSSQNREALEQRLNEDSVFVNTFNRLAANSGLLKAVREHADFARMYEKDQVAAVARHSRLFNDNTSSAFSLTYRDGEVQTQVTKVPSYS
ncbi:MAG: hypothetical protein MI741_01430 [Rhodospirillales bacterium]|nr:hypothetical protein [Rhodospirillales bacterium]